MGKTAKRKSGPRWSISLTLIIVVVTLAVLPAAGVATYALTQMQTEPQQLRQMRTVAIAVVASAATVALIVAIGLGRNITHPIRRLSGLLQAARHDQPLQPSIIESIPHGRGEIGQLGQMLGDMVATLHRRMTELSMAYEIGQDITASVEVDETLQAGDALSCEPGLYIPGIGGARVENMIYVTEDGVEELTKCPLDLPMGF